MSFTGIGVQLSSDTNKHIWSFATQLQRRNSRSRLSGKIYNYHFKETVCYKVFDEPVEYKNAAKLCNGTEGVFSTDPKLPRPIELSKSNLNPLNGNKKLQYIFRTKLAKR